MLTPISESELFIMQYLWSELEEGRPQKSFADILDHAKVLEDKAWKKQTVNTFLSRLKQKGFIEVSPTNRYQQYGAIITREEYLQDFLDSLVPTGKRTRRYQKILLGLLKNGMTARERNSLIKQVERL